jgi:PTS system nitrogen regulatory IIA component
MALRDYVCSQAICTDLQVEEREEAIRALLEKFVEGGALAAQSVGEVFEALIKRERLGSTAIGNGVAVPHARLDKLSSIAVGFARCPRGVGFNALDGAPVYEVFLVIASRDHNTEYISVMERITRLVQNPDFRRFVADAESGKQVLDLIEEMDR